MRATTVPATTVPATTVPATTVAEEVLAVAAATFDAMIDRRPGALRVWTGGDPGFEDPTCAWVDVDGPRRGRVLLTCEWTTATRITRGLLGLGPTRPVEAADVVDAFGELANVLGGHLKSLLPDPGALSLPQVSRRAPAESAREVEREVVLDWRGERLLVALHRLD